jgi:flagellar protein FlaG
VYPVDPVPVAAAVGHGGNSSPAAGDALPAHASAAQNAQAELIQLQAAVEGINRFLRDSQRQMLFQVDLKSGKETLTIVNPATGEVIRQIPSAQVLAAAANLQQAGMPMTGLFIDERA